MSEIVGINSHEVWDHHLSTAHPTLYNGGKTWIVKLKSNETGKLLETHDTKVQTSHGDTYDCEKLKVCFEWLKSVRDNYARPDIEKRRPIAAFCRLMESEMAELLRGKTRHEGVIITATYLSGIKELMEHAS